MTMTLVRYSNFCDLVYRGRRLLLQLQIGVGRGFVYVMSIMSLSNYMDHVFFFAFFHLQLRVQSLK